jgi:hypothetical protein
MCQFGDEGTGTPTWGVATAATALWLGTVMMQDLTEVTFIEESIGNYMGYGRTYIASEGAEINFESVPATYEQLPYLGEAGIDGVSGTSSSGSVFLRTYTLSNTAAQTIRSYTLEVGDDEDAEETNYAMCRSFNLTGSADEAVMLSSTWFGRSVTGGITFTAGITRPSVEPIIFNTGQLFIDTNTAGFTQVSNSFRSFSLDVQTGLQPVQTADGNLYFSFHKVVDPMVTLQITAEHTSDWDSAGEKNNWRNETDRIIRLRFAGSGERRLHCDLYGKWENFGAIEEEDGNSVLTGTFRAHYDQTEDLGFTMSIVNTLNALP